MELKIVYDYTIIVILFTGPWMADGLNFSSTSLNKFSACERIRNITDPTGLKFKAR